MRRIAVVDAPSNLGLRPPTATSVPGCAKAPGALRDSGLLTRLGARDAGCITPPRYDPAGWEPGDGVAQAEEIAVFVRRLADRIGTILATGDFPLVLGGDCSILLGAGLAMRRHAPDLAGRIGLVYVDGHSDFRHEGNASYVGAAAGEALALATGRGQPNLSSIEQRRPYFRDVDVVLLGIRTHDEYRLDLQAAGIVARAVPELRSDGAARSAQWARDQLRDCAGFWVHVDVDVPDPAVMPAVDAPDVGGIAYRELEILLSGLVADPRCVGVQVTVFDPDYDPDGQYAAEVTDVLVAGLEPLVTSSALAASMDAPMMVSAPPFAPPVSAPPVSAPPAPSPPAPSPPAPASPPPRAVPPVSAPPVSSPPARVSVPPVYIEPAREDPEPFTPGFAPPRSAPSGLLRRVPDPIDTGPPAAEPDDTEPAGPERVGSGWDIADSAGYGARGSLASAGGSARARSWISPGAGAPDPGHDDGEPLASRPTPEPEDFQDLEPPAVDEAADDAEEAGFEPPAVDDAGEAEEAEFEPAAADERGAGPVDGDAGEPERKGRAALRSVSLDSLPRDSVGPGGLRSHSPFVVPFVPSQAGRPYGDGGPIAPPESPLADVVPAARTPQDEEEPEPAS